MLIGGLHVGKRRRRVDSAWRAPNCAAAPIASGRTSSLERLGARLTPSADERCTGRCPCVLQKRAVAPARASRSSLAVVAKATTAKKPSPSGLAVLAK